MSPEQVRSEPVDHRTDIWAFGCVLYELLQGRSPFRGASVAEMIALVLKAEPDWQALPDRTPAKVRDLLRRCLQKDARHRLQSIEEARIEIEGALRVPIIAVQPQPGRTIDSLAVLPVAD